jgi:hypothetical protein
MNILLSDDRFKNKDYEILIAKSHGFIKDETQFKFSFHFIINGSFRFKNTNDARQLANLIKSISRGDDVPSREQPTEEDENKQEDGVTDFIDMSVYKNSLTARQKFRCLYSPKTVDDARMLVPIDRNGKVIHWKIINILKYMVGYCDGIDVEYFDSIPVPKPRNNKNAGKNRNTKKKKSAKKKKAAKKKDQSATDIDNQSENEKPKTNKNKPTFNTIAQVPDDDVNDDSTDDSDDADGDGCNKTNKDQDEKRT